MHDDSNHNDAWIRTHGLCRYYKRARHEVRALDNVDLSIKRGDFLAVVGASGSGKSTLINLLAGLDTPTSGHIEIENQNLSEFSSRALADYRAQKVGIVFQSFNLLAQHTAIRNVEMALYFSGTSRRERRSLAATALERLGLADRLQHRPLDLSGGEQQRVAIARALVKQPEVLFADEPTGNLDQENSTIISNILGELNHDGMTVVLVTHDLEIARQNARRVIKMNYGRIITPPEQESDGVTQSPPER
jgi:putative ABC transport system ATP-binding protein